MDVFTVVFGGLLLFFAVTVHLLGAFSSRSARDEDEIRRWRES